MGRHIMTAFLISVLLSSALANDISTTETTDSQDPAKQRSHPIYEMQPVVVGKRKEPTTQFIKESLERNCAFQINLPIENQADQELPLSSLKFGCGCMGLIDKDKVLAAGESAVVRIAVKSVKTGWRTWNVKVPATDFRPVTMLSIKGKVIDRFEVSPRRVEVGAPTISIDVVDHFPDRGDLDELKVDSQWGRIVETSNPMRPHQQGEPTTRKVELDVDGFLRSKKTLAKLPFQISWRRNASEEVVTETPMIELEKADRLVVAPSMAQGASTSDGRVRFRFVLQLGAGLGQKLKSNGVVASIKDSESTSVTSTYKELGEGVGILTLHTTGPARNREEIVCVSITNSSDVLFERKILFSTTTEE